MKTADIVLLAGVGLGAYVLLQRRAVAAAQMAAPRPATATASGASQALDLVNNLFGMFNRAPAINLMGTYDGRSQTPWDVTPAGPDGPRYNNPSAYVSGGNDGLAFNPVNIDPYNAMGGYALA